MAADSIGVRLSIILPVRNGRALAEISVDSLLKQADPIGTEIVVVDHGSLDGTPDHLESIFADAKHSGKLSIHRLERPGNHAKARNEAVTRSQGAYLAFIEPGDRWLPGRLERLSPLLARHDLILASNEPTVESSDWVRLFLSSNWAHRSSGVIRRTLFDEVGGFPEGYIGKLVPKRFPGAEDYEFWLTCLIQLMRDEKKERFILIPNQHVELGPEPLLPLPTGLLAKVDTFREAVSLMHIARKLPPRYWGVLAKRLREAGKTILKP